MKRVLLFGVAVSCASCIVLCFAACGAFGVSVKQNVMIGLQVSETALEGAQTIERSLCFVNPATESGPTCTNPIAVTAGLTKTVADPDSTTTPKAQIPTHQLIAKYFVRAFQDEILAENALISWQAGQPAPATVAQYQADISAALTVAQSLAPGALTQPLVTKIQTVISTAATVATAVGVK